MKRDDAKQLVSDGLAELNEALSKGQSDTLVRYLSVMSRFHRYSFGNLMLILAQRETATYVAGFRKWQELGRHVRKGEKGIGIFAPCRYKRKSEDDRGDDREVYDIRGFRVVHVFDVAQTEGDELPEFAEIGGEPGEYLARVEQVIWDAGIELRYETIRGGALGSSAGGTITVCPELSAAETCAILVHEYSHEVLHWQSGRRHECSKTLRETEAEAVAFVVCRAFGLDSVKRSADYIQLYRGCTETLAESLEFIQKTASLFINVVRNAEPRKAGVAHGATREATDQGHSVGSNGTPRTTHGDWTLVDADELSGVECAGASGNHSKEATRCAP
jgi:antirestriction protein ArdC